jgi:hypothetical protein
MKHHHDLVTRHTDLARRVLAKYDDGIGDTILNLSLDRPLAVVDAVREYLRADAGAGFRDLELSPRTQNFIDVMFRLMGQKMPPNEVSTQIMIAWQCVRYEQAGKRTYVVSRGLARRLLATELRGVRCHDLRLPYPSIYIAVDPDLGFRVFNHATGFHPLYGVYVTEDAGGWRLMLCGDGVGDDDALTHFHVNLTAFESVDAALRALRAHVLDKDSDWARQQGMSGADVGALVDDWFSIFCWVMNLVFYVTHVEPGDHVETNLALTRLRARAQKARGKKRDRLLARARGHKNVEHIIVGAQVKVDPAMPKTTGETRALLLKTLVAGHWQRYAVGPGRVDRRWVFKEPFWRGQGPEGSNVHEVR